MQLGQFQREAAQQLGVDPCTILNWEKGRTEPLVVAMPAIFRYLGYVPFPPPRCLPQQLLAKRQEMGWTIKEAAKQVGVDPGTWGDWERGQMILYRRHRALIAKMFGLSFNVLDREMTVRWKQLHRREF